MEIKKGKAYRVKGSSRYLAKKYGTSNPTILIEGTDRDIFGGSWGTQFGNPTCMMYGMRSGFESLPCGGETYYGKIGGVGELVHESELEEITIH